MKNLVNLGLALLFLTNTLASADAFGQDAMAGIIEKNQAISYFYGDDTVSDKLHELSGQGYEVVSLDAVPYDFVYGDEGAATDFLITAWLGKKNADYGWSAKFVVAVVNTDSWGDNKPKLIDHAKLKSFLREASSK